MASEFEIKQYKRKTLPSLSQIRPNSIYWIKSDSDTQIEGYITDQNGVPYNLKDIFNEGVNTISNPDGTITISGTTSVIVKISASVMAIINSALQSGDNVSELLNDAGYLTSFTETDPIFQASEASLFVAGDKANLDANTGDETTLSIQTKRPLKTVEGISLEGIGNINLNIPTSTSDLINDSDFVVDASYVHTDNNYTTLEKVKLTGIEELAEVNNISDVNATDLTDGGETTLHTHDSRYYTETEVNTLLNNYKKYLVKSITPTAPVTGTLTETILYTWFIPANTFSASDWFTIEEFSCVNDATTLANSTARIRFNTSNSLVIANTNLFATIVHSAAAGARYFKSKRSVDLQGGNIKGFLNIAGSFFDEASNNYTSNPFNPAVDNYMFFTIQLGNIADSIYMNKLIISK